MKALLGKARTATLVAAVATALLVIAGVALVLYSTAAARRLTVAEYLDWHPADPDGVVAGQEASAVESQVHACMAALGLPYLPDPKLPPQPPDSHLGPV